MSCLTRKLQHDLARFIRKHAPSCARDDVTSVRKTLIQRGVCPSDVTEDQLLMIIETVKQ
ncbi:hypothetical protein [Aestuariibacter salexigens]|uniref:hypothetical protein n=1 Tax=Aestuariibacter salexigens TaxID=226010 RepID=UPI0004210486|nr:hypothetical protein [Aestuariibacter salexigens]